MSLYYSTTRAELERQYQYARMQTQQASYRQSINPYVNQPLASLDKRPNEESDKLNKKLLLIN